MSVHGSDTLDDPLYRLYTFLVYGVKSLRNDEL
jgi:hypothetical protein